MNAPIEIFGFAGVQGLYQRDLGEVVEHFRLPGRQGLAPGPSRSYSNVAAVYAAVRAKAEAIAGMPLMVSTDDDQVMESGPLIDLVECPNPRTSMRAFLRST